MTFSRVAAQYIRDSFVDAKTAHVVPPYPVAAFEFLGNRFEGRPKETHELRNRPTGARSYLPGEAENPIVAVRYSTRFVLPRSTSFGAISVDSTASPSIRRIRWSTSICPATAVSWLMVVSAGLV